MMKRASLNLAFIFLLILTSFPSLTVYDYAWGQTGSEDDQTITGSTEPPPVENVLLNETGDDPDLSYINGIRDDVLAVGWPVVLFFHADWCFFCQAMKPAVDEAEEVFRERAVFLRINEANNSDMVEAYNITGFPTLVVVRPEKDVNVVISGYKEPAELIMELNYAMGETEAVPASWETCSDPVGGLFNHYSFD